MRQKDLIPGVLSKREEWNKWKDEVGDYIESPEPGLNAVPRQVAKAKEETNEEWFTTKVVNRWEKNQDLRQLLKR